MGTDAFCNSEKDRLNHVLTRRFHIDRITAWWVYNKSVHYARPLLRRVMRNVS